MGRQGVVLRVGDVDAALAAGWDALPETRGLQADIYDSWAWHASAWTADPGLARAARIPAVLDEAGRPVALLPVTRGVSGDWRSLGADLRPRSRVVTRGEEPDREALGLLAETLARGARVLALHRLPSRDPVTGAFLEALDDAGYAVSRRERSTDRLAVPSGDWAAHRRDYRSFDKYAERFARRISRTWEVTVQTYGTTPDLDAATGFEIFAGLQARSWKGPFPETTRRRRAELMRLAEARGWLRLYLLRIGGEPVAGHVWFRTGPVATWLSTAHDARYDALSPGTIVQWRAQEQVFAEQPPGLLDFLPGGSAQKDRLSPERPALLEVDAVRRSVVAGVELPARREARRALPAVRDRSRARVRQWTEQVRRPGERSAGRVRVVSGRLERGGRRVWRLDVEDPSVRRYLAVACGVPSPEAMAEAWEPTDTWWGVGEEPLALVRLDGADVVREVVRLQPSLDDQDLTDALSSARGRPHSLRVADRQGSGHGPPTRTHECRLRWPAEWTSVDQ